METPNSIGLLQTRARGLVIAGRSRLTSQSGWLRIGTRRAFAVLPMGMLLIAISQAQTFTTIVSFDYTDGRDPTGSLTQATNGNLYGTTVDGGANGEGLVYETTTAGALTIVYSFPGGNEGSQPNSGVIQGTNGNFYGTTANGGSGESGTVFELTSGGTLTTLHSFDTSDGNDPGRLKQGSDGNFYGTTVHGGADGYGTVFQMTPAGSLTTLHSFSVTDGANPTTASLTQGTDGSFYGVTTNGGASDVGTVYKITSAGSFTLLHSFSESDGSYPNSVIQAVDGYFYGTTSQGGANGDGTVFRITSTGTLTTLLSFDVTDGSTPNAGMVQASNGNLYGTTSQGGGNAEGTIYSITTGGVLTTLYSFGATTTAYPGGLIQARMAISTEQRKSPERMGMDKYTNLCFDRALIGHS